MSFSTPTRRRAPATALSKSFMRLRQMFQAPEKHWIPASAGMTSFKFTTEN
jgi:hypothetical protein